MSLLSADEPQQILQPHDPVSNEGQKVHTTIFTQNVQSLWHCPRDTEGNILLGRPPDISKLEYIIDYMRNNNVGAWLVQEMWEEVDEFDIEVGGYHIFCHNSTKGEDGRQHLFKGVGIILSPQFTIQNEEFMERFI
jgi:hypothetical protein